MDTKTAQTDDVDRTTSHDRGSCHVFQGRKQLQRGLKERHAQFIALGGTIGTGLFLGIGSALATSGAAIPLSRVSNHQHCDLVHGKLVSVSKDSMRLVARKLLRMATCNVWER